MFSKSKLTPFLILFALFATHTMAADVHQACDVDLPAALEVAKAEFAENGGEGDEDDVITWAQSNWPDYMNALKSCNLAQAAEAASSWGNQDATTSTSTAPESTATEPASSTTSETTSTSSSEAPSSTESGQDGDSDPDNGAKAVRGLWAPGMVLALVATLVGAGIGAVV